MPEPSRPAKRSMRIGWTILIAMALRVAPALGDDGPRLDRDVMPLLKSRCDKCHGPAKREGKVAPNGCAQVLFKILPRGGGSKVIEVRKFGCRRRPVGDLVRKVGVGGCQRVSHTSIRERS